MGSVLVCEPVWLGVAWGVTRIGAFRCQVGQKQVV